MVDESPDLFAWGRRNREAPPATRVQTRGSDAATAVQDPVTVPYEFPFELQPVIDELLHRRGRTAAITASSLARRANLFPDCSPAARGTKLRHLITQHLDALPFPIGATSTGFYRIASLEDARHYIANLLARDIGNLERLAAIVRSLCRSEFRAAAIDQQAIDRAIAHLSFLSRTARSG